MNEENGILKKVIIIILVIAISIISIFVISPKMSSAEFHSKTIEKLDETKMTVTELTVATAGVSAALAAVPGDATTPIANQIMELSSYLLLVVGAIFLEKMLLTLTGYVTFSYLIPISGVLACIYVILGKEFLKNLAIKLTLFGIAIFMLVPCSVKISELIITTHETSINQTIENAKNNEIAVEENNTEKNTENAEDENMWNNITDKVQDGLSSIGDNINTIKEKGERMLSNFIDAIAILIITSCIIPILVLILFAWIIKIIFGINIPTPNIKTIKAKKKLNKDIEE